jgi:hypothetical protein
LSPAALSEPDFVTVATAWPTLPAEVRKMIVGVVSATMKGAR